MNILLCIEKRIKYLTWRYFMFEIKKTTSSNKTVRLPDDLIHRLEALAYENDVSFNQLVVQCCEYALSHLANSESNNDSDDE